MTIRDPRHAGTGTRRTIASIFLHPACDLACAFCGAEAAFDTMTPAQVAALVAGLADRGFESVVFGGGEPTLWPHDLAAVCERARARDLLVQVSTHGERLDERLLRSGSVDRFLLPLESDDPRVHDGLRGGGHHTRALRAIEACFAAGREVTVTTVLCRPNLAGAHCLARRLEAWIRAGAPLHAWHVYRFTATGRGGRARADELSIDRDAFRSAVATLRGEAPSVRIYRRDDFRRATRVEYFWFDGGLLKPGSPAAAG